jgi:predicted enzyme related to lactoylglutathione lyase
MTGIPTGRIVWFDYLCNEPAAAQKFYAAVLGWSTQTYTMPGTTYTRIVGGGREIGGYLPALPKTPIFRLQMPYARWLPHLQVENANDSAVRIKQLGGAMIREPYPVSTLGKMAIAADLDGHNFALWQPAAVPEDTGWVGPPGTFCWCELYTTSLGSASRFYCQIAGFSETANPLPDGGSYHLFARDGAPRAGMRAPMPGTSSGWFAWARVADIARTVARASELEAVVNVPPTHMGASLMALVTDPLGATLGLMQPV